MRTPGRFALGLALLLIVVPRDATGQAVAGIVVSEDEQRAVPGALVMLVRDDGTPVDSTTTGRSGRYRVAADAPGIFLLHTRLQGYASYTSMPFRLAAGETLDRRIELPLVSVRALQIMAEVIGSDSMLQQDLPTLCGEELRPWESGIVVGVIRDRYTREPIPGALVVLTPPATADAAEPEPLTTLSNRKGTYMFCNVALGESRVVVRAHGWRVREVTVEARAGMIGWYDVFLYPVSDSDWSSDPGSGMATSLAAGQAYRGSRAQRGG